MPNGLTGDFDVVLEVSDTTVARLAGAMHQNGFADENRPSLPHVAWFRMEASPALGPEHGSVSAQIAAPRVVLIDGATDRVAVEIGIRARFRADPGSPRFADVFRGTLRATYRIVDVDSSCAGYRDRADDYLWLRVTRDSVSFDGVAYRESSSFALTPIDDQPDLTQRIGRRLAALLAGPYAPRPHRIGKRFKRMQSLSTGPGPGASGAVIPLGVGTEIPAGNLASVTQLFLAGHDFAVAVGADYILERVRGPLDQLVDTQRDLHISGDAGFGGGLEIDYHVRIDTADAQWIGGAGFGIPMGLARITVTGHGWATRLYRSGVYNIGSVDIEALDTSFTAEQFVTVHFYPVGEYLALALAGDPAVIVEYHGPFAGEVKASARKHISAQSQSTIGPVLAAAQAAVNEFAAPEKKAALLEMLATVDAAPGARFDSAAFDRDGIVLRGTVRLANRYPARASFATAPTRDGFDAIESWIPGGRVDSFEWTWHWFTNPVQPPPGPPGAAVRHDSFLLRRPHRSHSKYGLALGVESPLPGLDGMGRVCLRITGVQVDPVTGVWVPVQSTVVCTQFGYQFRLPIEVGPYLRLCDPLRAIDGRPAPQVGLLRVASDSAAASNTVIVHLGEDWHDDTADTLVTALRQCRCENVELLVLVLLDDGVLRRAEPDLAARLTRFTEELPAPAVIAEDADGRWAGVLGGGDTDGPGWWVLAGNGVPLWAHRGAVTADELARSLEERLRPSGFAAPTTIDADARIGARFDLELAVDGCPPIPTARPDTAGSQVAFVAAEHLADFVDGLRDQPGDAPPLVAVVVDGADEVPAAWRDVDIPAFADPDGSLTRRAGVRITPSVVTIDSLGRICDLTVGGQS